ncbi:MAG: molybdopterin adenylyltransferase [Alphaproteobacteria bacterium]|nr:molybdopterin adenylyltransferase [Alphaproteobacteria bacterium]MCA0451323.1 molybdopterin adenylyltransferase [Pseudomonadota bacterium]
MTPLVPIGIVTCSDRASAGIYRDEGGPAIEAYIGRVLVSPWTPHRVLIPDDRETIGRTLSGLVDDVGCALVFTTGGTGPSPRDVTPEATADICDRLLPGFGEAMRLASLAEVPTAILSRQIAGLRRAALIVNLPGRPAAIATCLNAVFSAIPYCIELAGGPSIATDPTQCRAFRPGGG